MIYQAFSKHRRGQASAHAQNGVQLRCPLLKSRLVIHLAGSGAAATVAGPSCPVRYQADKQQPSLRKIDKNNLSSRRQNSGINGFHT